MNTNDTRELLKLRDKIKALSPPERLILAAELIKAGKFTLAEHIASEVVGELQAVRMLYPET